MAMHRPALHSTATLWERFAAEGAERLRHRFQTPSPGGPDETGSLIHSSGSLGSTGSFVPSPFVPAPSAARQAQAAYASPPVESLWGSDFSSKMPGDGYAGGASADRLEPLPEESPWVAYAKEGAQRLTSNRGRGLGDTRGRAIVATPAADAAQPPRASIPAAITPCPQQGADRGLQIAGADGIGASAAPGLSRASRSGGLLAVMEQRSASPHGLQRSSSRDMSLLGAFSGSVGSSMGSRSDTSRSNACLERLDSRDSWNTYEIRIQEIFLRYDRDGSGALEVEEFRDLLRDFNGGRPPRQEEEEFMMKIADKNKDGCINLGELHYAIRVWHSYNNFDDNLLRLFAEFDADHSGRLDAQELQALLTSMNGGIAVPMPEVMTVMAEADVLGDRAINRSELLGAVAAWYTRVGRKDTDLPSLLREAVVRTAQDNDQVQIWGEGRKCIGQARAMVSRDIDLYEPVPQLGGRDVAGGPGGDADRGIEIDATRSAAVFSQDSPLAERLQVAKPFILRSGIAFCRVAFPFIFCWLQIYIGWETGENECPRNLDGILMWFGYLGLGLSILMCVNHENVLLGRARIALAVILIVLNLVGLLWVHDQDVMDNKSLCGYFLVYWSLLVWAAIPMVVLAFGCYQGLAHFKRLQKHDAVLQQQLVL